MLDRAVYFHVVLRTLVNKIAYKTRIYAPTGRTLCGARRCFRGWFLSSGACVGPLF